MALTPLDIHHKEFKPARFGGYKEEEVDSFLDQIADELEKFIQENVDLKQQIEHSKKRLSEFEEMQTSLQSALLAATKSAEAVKEQAKQESEMMLSQARETANSITVGAREEADSEIKNAQEQSRQMLLRAQSERQKLEKSMARLKDVKRGYIQSIRDLADAHLERISEIESDEDVAAAEEVPEPEPLEKIAARQQATPEKPPVEKPPTEVFAVENSQVEVPPVINQQAGDAGAKATPVKPPATPPGEPPVEAKVKPESRVIATDRPEVVEVPGTTVQNSRTEMSASSLSAEVDKPAAGAPPEAAGKRTVKRDTTAVSVREEPEAKPPPSSTLVEEVLSMEGDESIFGDFTEDGNGGDSGDKRRKSRKEKSDKHFFWE